MTRSVWVALMVVVPGLAWGAGPAAKDCPPLGSLVDFVADASGARA